MLNPDKHSQKESVDKKHDADGENDGPPNELLEKENLIDVGNEHHHLAGTEVDAEQNAGTQSDANGTAGPEPSEKKDENSGAKEAGY